MQTLIINNLPHETSVHIQGVSSRTAMKSFSHETIHILPLLPSGRCM